MKIIECVTFFMLSACTDSRMAIPKGDITGTYRCMTPKIKDIGKIIYQQRFTHRIVDGVDILVVNNKNVPKNISGPYRTQVYVVDGRWRYIPYYKNGKMKPYNIKAFKDNGQIHWELAEMKNHKRKLIDSGFFKRNRRGDLVYGGKKQKREGRCQRVIFE